MITKKTQLELFNLMQSALKDIDSNFDNSPSSIDYTANQKFAKIAADIYDYAQQASNAADPQSANMQQLKNILYMLALPALPATQSRSTLTATGDSGTIINEGMQFKDNNNNTWYVVESVTLPSDIVVNSLDYGAIVADIGAINQIITPIVGLESVTNNEIAILGREAETDAEIRERIRNTAARNGQHTADSLSAKLYELSGVEQVIIHSNRNNFYANIDGQNIGDVQHSLNPKSTLIHVLGGVDEEIVEVIANNYPVGENLNAGRGGKITGNEVTQAYTTPQALVEIANKTRLIGGSITNITFYKPEQIFIEVKVTISAKPNKTLSPNIADLIKQNIVLYSKGLLFAQDTSFDNTGYQIGEDVRTSDLATPINYTLGESGSYSSIEVGVSVYNPTIEVIDHGKIAIFQESNIEVIQ
jgi:hypothetical protein